MAMVLGPTPKGDTLASHLPGVVRILMRGDVPVDHFMGHLLHNPAMIDSALRYMCMAMQFNAKLSRWQEGALRAMVEMLEAPGTGRIHQLLEQQATMVQDTSDELKADLGKNVSSSRERRASIGRDKSKLAADTKRHWENVEQCAASALAMNSADVSRRDRHGHRRAMAQGILSCTRAGLGAKSARQLEAQVVPVVKRLVNCEHCMLLAYDPESGRLSTAAGEPLPKVRCPSTVAVTEGSVINVRLRKDIVFAMPCERRDVQLGTRSRTLLAVPVQLSGGAQPMGVLLAVNKIQHSATDDAVFSYADEALMIEMSSIVASASGNAVAFSSLSTRRDSERRAARESGTVVQMSPALFCGLDPEGVFAAAALHAQVMVGAQLALLFFLEAPAQELWTLLACGQELRMPVHEAGPAGLAVSTHAPANCPDVREDSRFAHAAAAAPEGLDIRAVVCAPVLDPGTGGVLGVLQAVNKVGAPGQFTQSDVDLLAGMCTLVAPVVRNVKLMQAAS
eukprot:CAMPEP_0182869612 /NCGR_PEP_ID=MMETSP0034_2-20130328/10039_1 /TAXON_ID=156128 /ORGANISM="Nephroselmis pyriformis, Strain CCMP717" /LENGTH=507 /DNA_ID=CAMNT_0025002075 /DNA_START=8 /DNA_END=1528 /DNA_ORIENTATION=-